MNRRPSSSLFKVVAGGTLSWALTGCSNRESVVLLEQAAATGSAQLALTVGALEVDRVTAVLSGQSDEFEPQTQSIEVRGEHGVVSAFFGNLPVGEGYSIELSASACSGSASFGIEAGKTTLVEATLSCPRPRPATGTAQSTGTIGAGANAPARDRMAPSVATPSIQPAPPAADAGPAPTAALGCDSCTRDFCAAQQDAVNARLDSVAAILSCVVGPDWQRAERANASSCANADLLGCYCGSVAPVSCRATAPAAVDGQCRVLLLTGAGCSDSACLQTNLLKAETATGSALRYVQCQQDYCYDLCFNP